MGVWNDVATWYGNSPNNSGTRYTTKGLVLHIAEGSFDGTVAWGRNPNAGVSYHFVIAQDGRCAQTLDTDLIAWTQVDGNGSWISVEFEGHTGDSLTPAMIESVSKVFAKICKTYGVPCQSTDSPSGLGLGHHSMGGYNWGNHLQCPGQPIINQKPLIIKRAAEILGGVSTPEPAQEEKLMFLIRFNASPTVFLSDGVTARAISSEAELKDILTLNAEGTIRLGYGGKVRVVGRKSLVGRIVGPVPTGFEDMAD